MKFNSGFKLAIGAILGLVNLWRGPELSARPEPPRPNVVLIVMDTVRKDRMSIYGYDQPTTPNLERLLKESRLYLQAYSTSCWTNPAHASLFTGYFPARHGTTQENISLDRELTTLAEILQAEGYDTVGIVENPMLSAEFGFDQGFNQYFETWKSKETGPDKNIALFLFQEHLKSRAGGRPFFIFVNLIEPHSPYDPPAVFQNQFVSDTSLDLNENMFVSYFLGWKKFSPEELNHLNELYDSAILYVDSLIGEMIGSLKAKGCWEDTVFIVTSDHGENIGDHEMMDHVFSLHETLISVPLIIRYPGIFLPGSRESAPVQLVDIPPTILSTLAIKNPAFQFQGRDLATAALDEGRPIFAEMAYPRQVLWCFPEKNRKDAKLKKYLRRLRAVITDGKKLTWSSDGKHQLSDLKNDPKEQINLIDDPNWKQVQNELISQAEDSPVFQKPLSAAPTPARAYLPENTRDNATREKLRSLGYLR